MLHLDTRSLSLEAQLLFLTARPKPSKADEARIRELAADRHLAWDQFIGYVRKQCVIPNCHQILSTCANEIVPEKYRSMLGSATKLNGLASLRLASQLSALAKLLDGNRIPFLSIKGPAFAMRVYDNFTCRHAGDIDLLVSPGDIEKSIAVLIDDGYRPLWAYDSLSLSMASSFRAELQLVHETGVEIDLHWRFDHSFHRFPLEIGAALESAELVEIAGSRIPTLSIEDTLLYHASHGAKHSWERLLWLSDIAALTSRFTFDWDHMLERSVEMQSYRSLIEGVFLAHSLLGVACPAAISGRIKRERMVRRIIRSTYSFITREFDTPPDHKRASWSLLVKTLRKKRHLFFLGRGFKYRWGVIMPMLWSPKDAEILHLPPALSPFYIVLRPALWLFRRFKRRR